MLSTGENIRRYRTKAGISMRKLSQKTKISQSAISLYERGRVPVPKRTAGVIAKALGVEFEDIYAAIGTDDKTGANCGKTLCWECSRVYKGRGCCWSDSFTPVPGWEAIPTVKSSGRYKTDSYNVRRCPLFDRG